MAPVESRSNYNNDEIDLGDLLNVLLRGWKMIALIFVGVVFLGVAYAFLGPATYEWRAVVQLQTDNHLLQRLGLADSRSLQKKLAEERLEQFTSSEVLLSAIRETQANTKVKALNRIPVLGALVAKQHEKQESQENQLAEPFLGLDGFAWGGERVLLDEFSLPLLANEQFFVIERTDDGFTLEDDEGNLLLEQGLFGERIQFSAYGRMGHLAVAEIMGRVGTRFQVKQDPLLDSYREIKDDLNIESIGAPSANEQIYELIYHSDDLLAGADFIGAVVRAYARLLEDEALTLEASSTEFLKNRLSALDNNVVIAHDALEQFQSSHPEVKLSSTARNLLDDLIEADAQFGQLKLQRDLLLLHYGNESFLIKALDEQLADLRAERYVLDELSDDYMGPEADLLRLQRALEMRIALRDMTSRQLQSSGANTVDADFNVSRPEVVKPKRLLVLAVSVLLGLMLGVFVVLMRAFLRPVIYAPAALQELTRLNTIGVPDAKLRRGWCACLRRRQVRALLTSQHENNPALESMRALRSVFAEPMGTGHAAKLAFVGPTADVGKSFIAVNIADLLALEGKRVLLIDVDMRRSVLHEYLGYEAGLPGLAQLLSGQAVVEDVLIKPHEGLTVLPAGVRPANPTELLLQPDFAALLEQLDANYDYVIFTAPPVLPVADTLAVLRHVDAGYLVIRAEQTTQIEVRDTLERLQIAGVKQALHGAILNGVTRRALGQGASYEHYYSYD